MRFDWQWHLAVLMRSAGFASVPKPSQGHSKAGDPPWKGRALSPSGSFGRWSVAFFAARSSSYSVALAAGRRSANRFVVAAELSCIFTIKI